MKEAKGLRLKKSLKAKKDALKEKKEDYYSTLLPKERRWAEALDKLVLDNIIKEKICTNTRDINAGGVLVHFHRKSTLTQIAY